MIIQSFFTKDFNKDFMKFEAAEVGELGLRGIRVIFTVLKMKPFGNDELIKLNINGCNKYKIN